MRRFLPRTLFGRGLVIIVTPLILLQVVAAYVFYDRHWSTLARHLAVGLAGDISAVARLLDAYPRPEDRAFITRTAHAKMNLAVTLEKGGTLAGAKHGTRYPELVKALTVQFGSGFAIDDEGLPRDVVIRVHLADGVMRIVASRKRLFSSTTYAFIAWMVGTSIVLMAIAGYFLRRQIRPIIRLAEAADAFGKGRPVGDFKPEGASEVRQAATAFLHMRERIRRQIAERTEMLAAVSHDLRTPLTRMKLQLAMLGDEEEGASLAADIAEMEKMIGGYLEFVRGEGGERPERFDLAEVLGMIAEGARGRAATVTVEIAGDLTVEARPGAVKRCFSNLVENALRHAQRIVVAARREPGGVVVTVDDDGPGIPPAEREAAFRAFHRLEASRNPETGGVGLGLTIARDIVRGHGGDIALADSPLGGLRVAVRLPL